MFWYLYGPKHVANDKFQRCIKLIGATFCLLEGVYVVQFISLERALSKYLQAFGRSSPLCPPVTSLTVRLCGAFQGGLHLRSGNTRKSFKKKCSVNNGFLSK